MAYCRSWTFNVGERAATAPVIVLHDNDMLVPVDYAASITSRVREGWDVVNLKRFIFYLGKAHTLAVLAKTAELGDEAPLAIVQNLEGGGSIAITKAGYEAIGGMDESFIGWGGEDNEFWERAQALRVWSWAHLPIVHLWHEAQAGKQDANYVTAHRYRALTEVDPAERSRKLRSLERGLPAGPRAFGGAG